MGTTTNPPPSAPPTQDDVYAAVQAAYNELEDLYDASEGPDSVQIFTAMMDTSKLLTALNQSHLESRTGEYQAIKQSVGGIITEIQQAQAKINNIIKVVATATQIAGVLDKAVKLVGKYFGLP